MFLAKPYNLLQILTRKYFVTNYVLKHFYTVPLSAREKAIAKASVTDKYTKAIANALLHTVFVLPAIMLFDSLLVATVLVPVTMVSGTAWFSISLASMKEKFEDFGRELTKDMFEAFVASVMLLCAVLFLAFLPYTRDIKEMLHQPWFHTIAAVMGACSVGSLLIRMISGSIKYDINDAMLTGQAEVAEQFFKRSLSSLYMTAKYLREGRPLAVSNYSIGTSFTEIIHFVEKNKLSGFEKEIDTIKNLSNKLRETPDISQDDADGIGISLVSTFTNMVGDFSRGSDELKVYEDLQIELQYLIANRPEKQEIADLRFAVIFENIARLLESRGEMLFRRNN
jgi:hypothetical protein